MERYFGKIRSELREVLQNDKNVDRSVFSGIFCEENLIEHVLDNIIILIIKGKQDCDILTEILDRLLYR